MYRGKGWSVWGTPGVIGVVNTKTLIDQEPYIVESKAIYHRKGLIKTDLSTS